MSLPALSISFMIGVLLAEIALRAFGGLWLRTHFRSVAALLQTFRYAEGDDARQAALLRCGCVTLQFSLTLLSIVTLMAVIAVLAPWSLGWDESQQIVYSVATSVVAFGWLFLRRPKIPSPIPPQHPPCRCEHE